MQKLVFFDIDGTLVTPKNELPETTIKAITLLKENGHLPIIATGRPPKMLEPIAKELGIDSFISLNGQYIVLEGQPIFRQTLPTDYLEELIQASYDNGQRTFLITKDDIIGNTFMREMLQDSEFLTMVSTYLNDIPDDVTLEMFMRMTEKPLKRERYKDEEILSAYIHTDESQDAYYKERFVDLHFTRATPLFTEVLLKGHHKGTGIQRILDKLGQDMKNTIAFGDGLNDLEMIKTVQVGVSMGNGRDALKEAADYVTTHVEEDGIFNALKKLELI